MPDIIALRLLIFTQLIASPQVVRNKPCKPPDVDNEISLFHDVKRYIACETSWNRGFYSA